jgi:hypothetical protein
MTYGICGKKRAQETKQNPSSDRVEGVLAPDKGSAHRVSPRKAILMTTSLQTSSLLDMTREAGPDARVETVVIVGDLARLVPGDSTTGRNEVKDDSAETITQPKCTHYQFAYPEWPTSKPGPQATSPPPGQSPHPKRTDQMVYACYDQERGMPCAPPPMLVVRHNSSRTYRPDASVQEAASLVEAIERWLDDGGTLMRLSRTEEVLSVMMGSACPTK